MASREEEEEEEGEEEEGVLITPQLLREATGEFSLESVLLLRLGGRGIARLGCLARCANLEWLDLSGNAIAQLAPLAALQALAVLNLARNRVTSLEPLGACRSLQRLDVAGNGLRSLRELRCLRGLRHLQSLRLRDPRARLANPLCATPGYRHAVADMLPGLQAIDGQRVSGRGSELYRLCRELDGDGDVGSASDASGAGNAGGVGGASSGSASAGGIGSAGGAGGAGSANGVGGASTGSVGSASSVGSATSASAAEPWVPAGFWAPRRRRSSVAEEAYRQFGEALRECRELSHCADATIAQAQRALGPHPDPSSFVF